MSAFDLVLQVFGVSTSSDPVGPPLAGSTVEKGVVIPPRYASPNILGHQMQTLKWHVQSCSSITFLTLVIQSTILQEANATGNVRYYRRDYESGEWGGGREHKSDLFWD